MSKALITAIQKFCTHDGDGIRTTVFLQGCPLRCRWCHNSETQEVKPQFFYTDTMCIGCRQCGAVCERGVHQFGDLHIIDRERCVGCMKCADSCVSGAIEPCATPMSVDEVMQSVLQDKAFYGERGGLTVSGGEPMVHPDFTLELLKAAKGAGINTAIETCGYFDNKFIEKLVPLCDMFLWDFKDGNSTRHSQMTGVSNKKILENLRTLDYYKVKIRLRCIMVRGVNTDEDNLSAIAKMYHSLSHCEGVQLLPYHTFGGSKSALLGLPDSGNTEWVPKSADIKAAKKYLKENGVRVIS